MSQHVHNHYKILQFFFNVRDSNVRIKLIKPMQEKQKECKVFI